MATPLPNTIVIENGSEVVCCSLKKKRGNNIEDLVVIDPIDYAILDTRTIDWPFVEQQVKNSPYLRFRSHEDVKAMTKTVGDAKGGPKVKSPDEVVAKGMADKAPAESDGGSFSHASMRTDPGLPSHAKMREGSYEEAPEEDTSKSEAKRKAVQKGSSIDKFFEDDGSDKSMEEAIMKDAHDNDVEIPKEPGEEGNIKKDIEQIVAEVEKE